MQAYVCRARGAGKALPAPPRHTVAQGWRHVSSLPPLQTVEQRTNACLGIVLGQEGRGVARNKRNANGKCGTVRATGWEAGTEGCDRGGSRQNAAGRKEHVGFNGRASKVAHVQANSKVSCYLNGGCCELTNSALSLKDGAAGAGRARAVSAAHLLRRLLSYWSLWLSASLPWQWHRPVARHRE